MKRSGVCLAALVPLFSIAMAFVAPEAHADEPEGLEPPAPGYHYEQKRYLAPIIAGASTFGAGWLASISLGLLGMIASTNSISPETTTNWTMNFIPIVGPFVTIGVQPEEYRAEGVTAALAVMGGAQVVGASLLIGGLAAGKHSVLVRDKRERRDTSLSVQPVFGPQMTGFLVGGSF